MLPKVMAASRTATAASATLLCVVEALFAVGTMFGLQKNISLLEPHTSSFDDRGRGEAASAIGPVT
jgi:hypothetical protein